MFSRFTSSALLEPQDAVEEGGHGPASGHRGPSGDKPNMAGKEMDRDGLDLQGRAAVSGRGAKPKSRGRGRGRGGRGYMQYVAQRASVTTCGLTPLLAA